jgi:hypothetical protein
MRIPRRSTPCISTSCWAADDEQPRGRRHRRGRTRRTHVGQHPWPARSSHAGGRRTAIADRLPPRRRARRRGDPNLPVDRFGRPHSAAHRAESDTAVLRWQPPTARRNGAARRAFRLAQAQRLCSADGGRRIARRAGPIRPRRGGLEPADGILRGNRRWRNGRVRGWPRAGAGPLRGRMRRRSQRHPPSDGSLVRRHHILDALARHRLRQRSARSSQQ